LLTVSPRIAPRPCPIVNGPVGLALTNSTNAFFPVPDFIFPKSLF